MVTKRPGLLKTKKSPVFGRGFSILCRGGDSNSHGFLHMHLKHACLPFHHRGSNLQSTYSKPPSEVNWAIRGVLADTHASVLAREGSRTGPEENVPGPFPGRKIK